MNFKRHWDSSKSGCTAIYTSENSACKKLEVSMLSLNNGESYTDSTGEKEFVLYILGGKCDVSGDNLDYKVIGSRKNVFDGKATALYIPRHTSFTVTAVTEFKAAVVICPTDGDYEPHLVTPDDIVVKTFGKPGFEREVHFVVDERMSAGRVYIGENFIEGGQWSGYPAHKHDENTENEAFAEEIYYFEYDKPTGYGIQQAYTSDRRIDEAYTVRNGDFVELPYGYHPCTVAPGYKGYLLWLMSCDKRGLISTTDPEQKWILEK